MAPACDSSDLQLFGGGNEKANLMLSTGVLQKGWSCLKTLQEPYLKCPVTDEGFKYTIFAFSSGATHTMGEAQGQLDASLELLDRNSSPLGFLITEGNEKIGIHRPSLSAFHHLLNDDHLREELNNEIKNGKQLILVGRSLGGSVAALFVLWLLNNQKEMKEGQKEQKIVTPYCITYGSPFIGDAGLQKAVGKFEKLKAQLWHVVGDGDFVPYAFVVPKLASEVVPGASEACELKPFGTYLFCGESGCTCIDHPDSVMDLLQISEANATADYDYGAVLQRLKKIKHRSNATSQVNSTLEIGLSLQLQALGIDVTRKRAAESLKKMQHRERILDIKRKFQNTLERLLRVKRNMALLKSYKKKNAEWGMDYYDCYKARKRKMDLDVDRFKRSLNWYWERTVEEAENNLDYIPLRDFILSEGTTYRLLVEPMDIAIYYRKTENSGYVENKARPRHYILLEKWHREQKEKNKEERKENKDEIQTEDSCFWARVEEAMLDLKKLRRKQDEGDTDLEGLRERLKEFEGYVSSLDRRNELSKTVFFEESTFMKWWKEYKTEPEHYHDQNFLSDIKKREKNLPS